jgi:hypothetical protein
MVVWGGVARGSTIEAVADGAAFDPAANSWRSIAAAPSGGLGVVGSTAAWTGEAAVFWAGNSPDGPASGAVYDPATDTWRRLPDGPLGPREGYVSVWTGKELLIIAGTSGDGFADPVAAAVHPGTGPWRLLPALNDLRGLMPAGAVWDGHQVFLAGTLCPERGSSCTDSRPIFLAYDPRTDALHEIDLTRAPVSTSLTPIGMNGSAVVLSTPTHGTVGIVSYDPASEAWRTGPDGLCPVGPGGFGQTAWLGDRYVVPCGKDRLQIYDVVSDSWSVVRAGPSPFNSREGSAIAWTGPDLLVWSGVANRTMNPTPDSGAAITLSP